MKNTLERFDRFVIDSSTKYSQTFARLSLFAIYFWFGSLKVIGSSPANPLVQRLLEQTMPWITFDTFIILFGVLEALIGLLFLIRNAWISRLTIALMWLHMATTMLPLFVLPQIAWSGPFVPTLEGQYIIKNIALIALTIQLASTMPKKNTL